MDLGVSGLRVLVTAGGAGIGRAMAEAFSAGGAKVHLCDIDDAALEDTAKALPAVTTQRCDVADPKAVDAFFAEGLERLGGLDVLINNAGISGPTKKVEEIADDEWRQTLSVNLDGQFYCIRKAVPALREAGGGSIVNLSSAAGRFGFPLRTPYVASKWAIVGMTKSLAMELGKDKIRVNCLCPGAVDGDRIRRVIAAKAEQRGITEAEMEADLLKDVSLNCFVSAEDIANMAVYLASPAGATISGQALSIDGNVEVLK
jgi:NAD(P)-dependent dehydrogenase (short-subunit alcohol dehydrogenase family)